MTTTLRPAEPLQTSDDGGRSRRYQVCVNGRPVGGVHLSTHPGFGPSVAVVRDLRIDRSDRGRGRGVVAALAAEEVARTWGCTSIEAPVPAASDQGMGLAAALGYVERGSVMDKAVGPVVPLPPDTVSRPMTPAEYEGWAAASRAEYAQSWIERGVAADAAYAKAERDHATALPRGLATEDALLRVLEHAEVAVGTLWLALRPTDAFVMTVEVVREHRRRGHGRTLMQLAENGAAEAGRERIGLHVFAGNTPALRLYAALGYRATLRTMCKQLA